MNELTKVVKELMIIVDKENERYREGMWSQLVLGGHVGCCQVSCWGDDCLSKCWPWKKFLKQVETLLLSFTKELKVVAGVRRS